ncbi:lactate utilization protein [Ornithobacterium rhinotracheale]|uniref:lactate utilization protein B n=1 Tax=Ornithobacterium rhinotracheale TaxID=28251 RepID=UPI00129C3D0F|nr:lactate utilization protein B [Ornithobacterium rhinotracheale]MRJ08269.1 lactate utilization protein [Ornithobacterium rhinotracheale]UOH77463.1 lactate utilization protein [Ornithobacterium rhinotracheale]
MSQEKVDIVKNSAEFINQDNIHEPMHDRVLWASRMKRDKVASEIPEWEQLRDLASQIKEHTLSHLDQYVLQFAENAEKKGIIVHWAKDGDEHNQIVLDIIQKNNRSRLIKSKSMLQEECGMTPFLEQHGIEVVESDLGERIQQLSQERPSHIVVPAVHKTVEDVSKLFAEKIGTDPNNNDAVKLTEAMRQNARPKFLKADVGMTGANFAIAETGTFVVCTNEGNADLTASLPNLHIASIGIEKIIPRVEDMGVFIRLLSRSALGTPATQYTSHFSAPRDGAEMHIVLVDNGRSKRLGNDDFWKALKCIRCGACMNTCPVYRRSGGLAYGATYSGPIGIILDPSYDEEKYSELPFHSSLCGSCTEVCPVHINISDQIMKWRQVMVRHKHMPWARRKMFDAADQVLGSPKLFRTAEKVGHYAEKFAPDALIYFKANGYGEFHDMPEIKKQTFRDWYLKNRKE